MSWIGWGNLDPLFWVPLLISGEQAEKDETRDVHFASSRARSEVAGISMSKSARL